MPAFAGMTGKHIGSKPENEGHGIVSLYPWYFQGNMPRQFYAHSLEGKPPSEWLFFFKTTIPVLSRVLTQLFLSCIIPITGPEGCALIGQGDAETGRSQQARINLEV